MKYIIGEELSGRVCESELDHGEGKGSSAYKLFTFKKMIKFRVKRTKCLYIESCEERFQIV